MKKILFIMFVLTALLFASDNSVIKLTGRQLLEKDKIFKGRFPVYTKDGVWTYSKEPNWFSGFTSGELWYLFDMTGEEEFKARALAHADSLIKFSTLTDTHDMGFIFFNSCVQAYKHTGARKYKDAAVQAARMLVKRFNAKGNFIRAWGDLSSNDKAGWMIIDTMMNLELLFWASEETGDSTFYNVAYKHAVTCMKQNIRADYSSYHVVEFDPENGNVIKRKTHQGYADETTWARGEAWGIYGFAIAYNYTKDERFLAVSENMAGYFTANLPQDYVPYWDFSLKGDNLRDASAAAVAASGMYRLSELLNSGEKKEKYLTAARKIIGSLQTKYLFTNSKRKTEEGILLHTVYNFKAGMGVDESFPCGDFYFIECLYRTYFEDKNK